MILLLAAVIGIFPEGHTGEWYTLLQRLYRTGCSADYLVAGETGVIEGNLPVVALGALPDIPWPEATVVDPIAGGLWSGGRWNVSIGERSFQDSLSISRIGLIQNTEDHSRYIFQLDRPLPRGTSGNFELLREDTLRLFSAAVSRGRLGVRAMSWEGHDYGWGTWVLWKTNSFYARTGFARLSPGDRRPEVLAGGTADFSSVVLEAGASASYIDSTLEGRGVAGISTTLGRAHVSGNFEYTDNGEGFWGGVVVPSNGLELSAAVSRPAGGDLFQMVALRHKDFNLVGRFQNGVTAAADAQAAAGIFRGKAAVSWNFATDSLAVTSWMLLGKDWYRGRFEAGPRVAAGLNSVGEFAETVDILLGFTLVTFSLSTAVEDVTHDEGRNWSFGITWSYTDQPPVTPLGETEDRVEH